MTSLCESPFINDAFQKKERIEKILKLEQQDRRQKDEILNLQVSNFHFKFIKNR